MKNFSVALVNRENNLNQAIEVADLEYILDAAGDWGLYQVRLNN